MDVKNRLLLWPVGSEVAAPGYKTRPCFVTVTVTVPGRERPGERDRERERERERESFIWNNVHNGVERERERERELYGRERLGYGSGWLSLSQSERERPKRSAGLTGTHDARSQHSVPER